MTILKPNLDSQTSNLQINNKKIQLLKVAIISKCHGLKGEIFVKPLNPQSQWPEIQNIFITTKPNDSDKQLLEIDFAGIDFNSHADPADFKEVDTSKFDCDPADFSQRFIKSYQVESYKPHKSGFIFKLKNLNSIEEAEKLKFCNIYLNQDLFVSSKGEQTYLSELLNFKVFINQDNSTSENHTKQIGEVCFFKSSPYQDYLIVKSIKQTANKNSLNMKSPKTISIPFVEAYIQKIDFEKKQITLKLPENFLNINES